MGISGLGTYNYTNNYTNVNRNSMSRCQQNNNSMAMSTVNTSSNITLHFSGTEESGNALTSVGFPDGSSASVYKADNYSSATPEYRVRYWDTEGNYTDTNVNVGQVDPSNATYLEMLAYSTYSDVQGITTNAYGNFLQAAGGVNGDITYDADSVNEKKNYMGMVKEFMQLQYDSNNLVGYLSFKEFYDYMDNEAKEKQLFSEKKWNQMLEKVDNSIDEMKKSIESETEKKATESQIAELLRDRSL